MQVIVSRNADQALLYGLQRIGTSFIEQDSRNGPVLRFPEPVTSVYKKPRRRVLFNAERNCNPFLHLFESLWMLNGNNDVFFPGMITKQMFAYSDDQKTLNGAYGHRWRNHFGIDQIEFVINELKNDPNSRRAHVQMWDGKQDVELLVGPGSRDVPCNHAIDFEVLNDRLNMVVYNRSNDMVWGAYGANLVHFSFLQEYIACAIGVKVGTYYQVSRNAHIYTENPVTKALIERGAPNWLPTIEEDFTYHHNECDTSPLLFGKPEDKVLFDNDCRTFFSNFAHFSSFVHSIDSASLEEVASLFFLDQAKVGWESIFFKQIVQPMALAYGLYKSNALDNAIMELNVLMNQDIAPYDWILNASQWLTRIKQKREEKSNG